MQIIACGINHKTAPIAIRERLAFNAEDLSQPLHSIVNHGFCQEAALLSTCNRTEIYCTQAQQQLVTNWLSDYCQLSNQQLQPHLYYYQNQQAISHMLRVASGLDSMVLGETQIFQQMKQAYQLARRAGTLGNFLHRVFQYVFQTTKKIRHTTAISTNPISIAYMAASLAKRIFSDLKQTTVMLVGAGNTIELTAKYLKQMGSQHILVSNRSAQRAHTLASQLQAEVLAIDDLLGHLHKADILITATKSRLPIIGKGAIETALKYRKHQPMYLIDLAVPRDIEAQVAELSNAYLYNIDDLQHLIKQGLAQRQVAAQHAEQIITTQTEQLITSIHSLESVNTIKALRQQAMHHKNESLAAALLAIKRGAKAEDVIKKLGHQLTNKLLHAPCTQLRHAASKCDQNLLAQAERLFQLEIEPKNTTKAENE